MQDQAKAHRQFPYWPVLYIFAGCVAVVVFLYTSRIQEHKALIAYVKSLGGGINSHQIDIGPDWLPRLVKQNCLDLFSHDVCEVDLSLIEVTDEDLIPLRHFGAISALELNGKHITNNGLRHLGTLPHLSALRVVNGQGISDDGIRALSPLTNLHYLELDNRRITDSEIDRILNNELLFLSLTNSEIGDECIRTLLRCKSLYWLDLSGTRITDSGLSYLNKLPKLSSLFISDTGVTDGGTEALKKCLNLYNLHMENTKITNEGVRHLSSLKHIADLNLKGTQIGDNVGESLKHFSELQTLDLSNTDISDAGLEFLDQDTVSSLSLANTKITDACIPRLKKLKSLNYLDVRNTRITNISKGSLGTGIQVWFDSPGGE